MDRIIAHQIAERVREMGGRSYYVGGYVRDQIMGIENKDIDIEIHGIPRETLLEILKELGELVETGAEFGVYGLKGHELDIALPRQEKAVGKGHKDFEVTVDPFLGTKVASSRRDFTINALMQDVLSGEIVDHYHGLEHLDEKLLMHVNGESFAEDPLRLFRGAQFASRFHFSLAEETILLCQKMDTKALPKERVFGEMKKALLKAEKPSIFFEALREMNQLSYWFSEIEKLQYVKQSQRYHMEGNVWIHTMMVLDEAASRRNQLEQPLSFMLAALCHDFGKITATTEEDGQIHAYGHEIKGLPLVKEFLERIYPEKSTMEYVLNMVRLHMKPHVMGGARSKVKKTNQLFDDSLAPYDLIQLAECDAISSHSQEARTSNEEFLLERLRIYQETMNRPYVMGRDLVEAGLKPDKNFSDILAYAHKLRLAGVEKENALLQTLNYAKKKQKKRSE